VTLREFKVIEPSEYLMQSRKKAHYKAINYLERGKGNTSQI